MVNKVLYLTSAMDTDSFKEYLKGWSISPNLSNQNFHNKLIRSISKFADVDVICHRSINKNYVEKMLPAKIVKEGGIYWKYLYTTTNKISKYFHLWKRINKITLLDQDVVVVDTLNLSLLRMAIKLKMSKRMKIIGVCTDNPMNISYTRKHYRKKLLHLAHYLDGYIVLTDKLNELYNVRNKPYVRIDGVSEERNEEIKNLVDGKYIYFGGSLMKEYGVYSLIEAFKALEEKELKLILCGHHVNKSELEKAITGNNNIQYLGPVDYLSNLSLERNASVTVNPRPQNENIDLYSFPSKTLEFLANGCLTIAVKNPLLMEHYQDSIIWSESGSSADLLSALQNALKLSEKEKADLVANGRKSVMEYTSLENVSKELNKLFSNFFLNK